MGFFNLGALLQSIPFLVIGIQQMHKDAGTPGVTKKQLAMEATGLAGAFSTTVLTGDNAKYAGIAADLVSSTIDNVTQAFKKAGVYGFTPSGPITDVNVTGKIGMGQTIQTPGTLGK